MKRNLKKIKWPLEVYRIFNVAAYKPDDLKVERCEFEEYTWNQCCLGLDIPFAGPSHRVDTDPPVRKIEQRYERTLAPFCKILKTLPLCNHFDSIPLHLLNLASIALKTRPPSCH